MVKWGQRTQRLREVLMTPAGKDENTLSPDPQALLKHSANAKILGNGPEGRPAELPMTSKALALQ